MLPSRLEAARTEERESLKGWATYKGFFEHCLLLGIVVGQATRRLLLYYNNHQHHQFGVNWYHNSNFHTSHSFFTVCGVQRLAKGSVEEGAHSGRLQTNKQTNKQTEQPGAEKFAGNLWLWTVWPILTTIRICWKLLNKVGSHCKYAISVFCNL